MCIGKCNGDFTVLNLDKGIFDFALCVLNRDVVFGFCFLGIGLATFATLIDPEAIVIAGGVSKAGKWLADPAQESFEQHVFQNIRGKVDIILSTVNDRERDILGASVLAWNVKEYSLFK